MSVLILIIIGCVGLSIWTGLNPNNPFAMVISLVFDIIKTIWNAITAIFDFMQNNPLLIFIVAAVALVGFIIYKNSKRGAKKSNG